MKKLFQYIYLTAFICLLILNVVVGQTASDNKYENKLQKKAEQLFNKEDFVDALPFYSQLLSVYPENPVYNYKFGVCNLMADRQDIKKSIKYLEFAKDKPKVDIQLYYYLGLAYHLDYQFNKAIEQYNEYIKEADEKAIKKFDVNRKIEMCNNGKNLLTNINDLYVIEKKQVSRDNFYHSYRLDEFGGKLFTKPIDLKSKIDKIKEKTSIVFFSDINKSIYFSSYGIEKYGSKDIYVSYKLTNDRWGKPEKLSDIINTPYDENYPYILPDGKTLYFSSKGHNSMGGYDIFKSVYDPVNEQWSKPVNMDFAINTPYDDILFVSDTAQKYAYFSSTRNSKQGMLIVYNVRIDKKPETKKTIEFPPLYAENEQDTNYMNTLAYIKEKENPDVNATHGMFEEPVITEDALSEQPEFTDNITNEQIVDVTLKQAKTAVKEANKVKTQKDVAYNVAEKRNNLANQKKIQAEQAFEKANTITDPNEKTIALSTANQLETESKQLEREAEIADNIFKQLEEKHIEKQKQAQEAIDYAHEVQQSAKISGPDSSLASISELSDNLETTKTTPVTTKPEIDDEKRQEFVTKTKQESKKYKEESKKIKKQADKYKSESDYFTAEAERTKNKKRKKELLATAENSDNKAKAKQAEADIALSKSKQLEHQADNPDDYIAMANNAEEQNISNNEIYEPETEEIEKPFESDKTEVIVKSKDKEKLISDVYKHVESIKKDADDFNHYAKTSLLISEQKNKLSKSKSKQAEDVLLQANLLTNKEEKTKQVEKAKQLTKQSIQLSREAVAAYNVSQKLKSKAQEKQIEANQVREKAKEIESFLNSNLVAKANKEIDDLNKKILQNKENVNINELVLHETTNLIDQKQKENVQLLKKSEELGKESKKLTAKANTIRQKADQIKGKNKKQQLIKQAEEFETYSDDKQKQADENSEKANQLQIEIAPLKMQIEYTNTILSQVETKSKDKNIDITPVNEDELENQIADYKSDNIFSEDYIENAEQQTFAKVQEKSSYEQTEQNIALNQNKPSENKEIYIEQLDTNKTFRDAENLKSEADNYLIKAEQIKKDAANINDPEEKTKAMNQAYHLEQLANDKQLKSFETYGIANQSIYNNNKNKIKEIRAVDDKNDQLSIANMLEDESNYYFDKAAKNRQLAEKEISVTTKKSLLKDAYSDELIALKKQKKAKQIYQEQYPVYKNQIIANKNVTTENYPSESISNNKPIKETVKTYKKNKYDENKDKIGQFKTTETDLVKLDTIKLLEEEAQYYFDQSYKYRVQAKQETDNTSKQALLQEANSYEQKALGKQNKIIKMYQPSVAKNISENQPIVNNFSPETNLATSNKNVEEQEPLKTITEPGFTKMPAKVVTGIIINNIDINNNENIIAEKYNEINPIPIDKKIPRDLIFKVQIGAFRYPIPQDIFEGISPIIGETTPFGFIRYTAGMFVNYNNAVLARNKIRELGYNDAFVVAFYNQKRMLLYKAVAMSKGEITEQEFADNITDNYEENPFVNDLTQPNATENNYETSETVIRATNKTDNIKGLFYSVQVGVYTKPLSSDQLFNIKPLYTETMSNGYLRYVSGIFDNIKAAVNKKNIVIDKGVTDAFVVAYLNGKKIDLTQAKNMQRQGTQQMADINQYNISVTQETQPLNEENNIKMLKENIAFKVQIGAYKEEVPIEVVDMFLKISDKGIEHYKDEQGLTIYTAGNFKDYNSANEFKNKLIESGVKDAFIIALQNNKKISVKDAVEMLRK